MFKVIGSDGQVYGPISAEEVRRWITEGRLNAQSLVQAEGSAEWKTLATFAEFSSQVITPAAPPAIGTARIPGAEKKLPAGILGILLGFLGVHKFILGYTAAGVIMLGVSVAVPVVTCGFGLPATAFMAIIGLVEGIIYLTKSDEEFVQTYIKNQRPWF